MRKKRWPVYQRIYNFSTMNYLKLFLSAQILFLAVTVSAQNADSLFIKGNQSYTKGNFGQAIEYYNLILQSGSESPELYLNLGNAHFREQDYGHARLYYEKAKKLNPFLAGIDENIELIQSFVIDKITILPQTAIKNDVLHWLSFYNSPVSLFFVAIFTLLSAYLIFRYYGLDISGITRYGYIGVLSLTILLQTGALTFVILDYTTEHAIVTTARVDVKSEPDATGTTVFTIHSATKVTIKNTYENWYFIQLENGNTGWLESKSIEKV